MSAFSKLIGMAQKALGEDRAPSSGSGSGSGLGSGSGSGSGDWRSVVWQAADRLTGDGRPPAAAPAQSARPASATDPADRAAIARYDYLLQTADPHQVEQVHREAFARLTPAQREQVQSRMRSELPAHEQPRSSGADDLARAAARTEASRPGLLRGLLARAGAGGSSRGSGAGLGMAAAGMGVGAVGGVLAAVAGGAIVSSVAGPLLDQAMNLGVDFDALASGIDVESIAGGALGDVAGGVEGLTGGVEGLTGDLAAGAGDLAGSAGEAASGFGDQLGGLGDRLGSFGLDDLFGR
ncbi:hypothetical protein ACFJGV_15990 [Cnuibacter sp. UC19_7]|uniref:hypothetical protein n=1 Tax=Cnuibacter sp. UC19_7 TaxID=3350166 RepID=UPI0036710393